MTFNDWCVFASKSCMKKRKEIVSSFKTQFFGLTRNILQGDFYNNGGEWLDAVFQTSSNSLVNTNSMQAWRSGCRMH